MTIRKIFTLTTILFAAFSFNSCSSDDDDDENKNDAVADKHEYVDLGLPSGTLWATCNVGASKPEEIGDYFAWGEIEPKETYQPEKYKWSNDNCETFTKYCTNSRWGNVDNNLELLPEDDAATAIWGSNWCTPSKDQFNELTNSAYTTTEWIAQNGVKGMKITSKKNGKTLFFPAAGVFWYDKLSSTDEGTYWTRSVEETDSHTGYVVDLDSYGANWGLRPRASGYPVRPVRSSK